MGVKIKISESKLHGRGVFSATAIEKGELITQDPTILVGIDEGWGYAYALPGDETAVLALGPASMVNHAEEPNADVEISEAWVSLYATCEIPANEEILIDYGPVYWEELGR